MTPAARLSAAIELIDTIDTQRVPAAKALKEWGTAHRFAGSGDRAAISGLVWDVLYQFITSFRWDRDWPTSFQVAAGVIEGVLVWGLILTKKLPGRYSSLSVKSSGLGAAMRSAIKTSI